MLKIALIGYGYWGSKLARNFQNLETFKLISIADIKSKNLSLAKKNLNNIINNKYNLRKQILSNGRYFNRKCVKYKNMVKIIMNKSSLKNHNRIRSLIFPAYQLPLVNGVKVLKSIYKNKKIYLTKSSDYKFK